MNDTDLEAAFLAHKEGQSVFSRRMAITLADFFDMPVRTIVLRLELIGCLKQGSWDWFVANGGFTQKHFDDARADRTGPLA